MSPTAPIELWLVDLEACANALEALELETHCLSPDDRKRAEAIADPRERRHRLAAYTALRVLLERIAGAQVRGMSLTHGPGGKPGLGGSGVEFSLSHTRGLALIAVGRSGPLGIDLEQRRPIKMSPRAALEMCAIASGLGGRLAGTHGSIRAVLQAWTRLEAFAKARGLGVARTLTELGQRGRGGVLALSPAELETAARRQARTYGLSVRDVRLGRSLHAALAAPSDLRHGRVRPFPAHRPDIQALLAGAGAAASG
jgi:phosphopantetheinyl transferase